MEAPLFSKNTILNGALLSSFAAFSLPTLGKEDYSFFEKKPLFSTTKIFSVF